MGININTLSVSQARQYYLDYNNGNECGLTDIQYRNLCTRFKNYIDLWDQDETSYNQSPQDRLDFDADDAGVKAGPMVRDGIAAGAGIAVGFNKVSDSALNFKLKGATGLDSTKGGGKLVGKNDVAATKSTTAGNKVNGLLLVAAALVLANALIAKSQNTNADAAEACLEAQELLDEEQIKLAKQALEMEKKQKDMESMQENAIAINEEGQSTIGDMEGAYNYYYSKIKDGTATQNDIMMMRGLQLAMGNKQIETNKATEGVNAEIVTLGEELYKGVSENIEVSDELVDYVASFDKATRNAAIAQGAMMALASAGGLITATKCFVRASALAGSLFGSWAAVLYVAAGAAAGVGAYIYGDLAKKNLVDYRGIAVDTMKMREDTSYVSEDTKAFQETSMEFWDGVVSATNTDNLFTLTPTYANASTTTSTQTADAGTTGAGGVSTGGEQAEEDDPNKKEEK